MSWHILRKDCRLLWPLILIVTAMHFAKTALYISLGHFGEPQTLRPLGLVFSCLALLGLVVLVVAAIHQDVLTDVRQDWLVRPIKRMDLLLAKILFVVLMVHGPLLIADWIEGLVSGISIYAAAYSALSRGLVLLCLFSIPAALIASVTRNLTEVIAGLLTALIGVFVFGTFVRLAHGLPPPLSGTGLQWITFSSWCLLAVAAAALVLPFQFSYRHTGSSRGLMAGFFGVALLAILMPWKSSFAIQRWLAPQTEMADTLSLAFQPSQGRFQVSRGASNTTISGTATIVHLPLLIAGLPTNALLLTDNAEVRLLKMNGSVVYQGSSHVSVDGAGSITETLMTVREDEAHQNEAHTYQKIAFPSLAYNRLKNEPLRMEIEYFVTLFRSSAVHQVTNFSGEQPLADFGTCATRVDRDGDEIELACLDTKRPPSCFSAVLEHAPSGLKNPEIFSCTPNYAPFSANLLPSIVSRFGGGVPFFDPSGLRTYPVNASKLAESRLVLTAYEPQSHFTRKLIIPEIRLSDWEAVASTQSPSQSDGAGK